MAHSYKPLLLIIKERGHDMNTKVSVPNMNHSTIISNQAQELVDAQTHIWNHVFAYHNSMALKCALELGVFDSIQREEGKSSSLTKLVHSLGIHPSKASSFHRLMRLLCHSNFFFLIETTNGEPVFGLTPNSQLLLKDHPLSLAPFVIPHLEQTLINPSFYLSIWFKSDDETPFNIANGSNVWEYASLVESFSQGFNRAMASDAHFIANLMMSSDSECKCLFEGIESFVDVGGGDGTLAKSILKARPRLKGIVLDLPHVVNGLKEGDQDRLVYVGGDMFEAIPHANAVLLKWILHDWSDEHCIKILEKCKEAISNKAQGGKVIIIDIVVENTSNGSVKYLSTQYLLDMHMMSNTSGGKERNEEEWKKLFIQAGFKDYKLLPVLGPRSVIVVYPF